VLGRVLIARADVRALLKAAEAIRAKRADVQNLRQIAARHQRDWLDETEQKQ
jgi:hypothetical protein